MDLLATTFGQKINACCRSVRNSCIFFLIFSVFNTKSHVYNYSCLSLKFFMFSLFFSRLCANWTVAEKSRKEVIESVFRLPFSSVRRFVIFRYTKCHYNSFLLYIKNVFLYLKKKKKIKINK